MKINNIWFTEQETNHLIASLSYVCKNVLTKNEYALPSVRSCMKKLRILHKDIMKERMKKESSLKD